MNFNLSLFLMQVLDHWYQKLPPSYTVADLIDAATDWQKSGYLDRNVIKALNKHVSQDATSSR